MQRLSRKANQNPEFTRLGFAQKTDFRISKRGRMHAPYLMLSHPFLKDASRKRVTSSMPQADAGSDLID